MRASWLAAAGWLALIHWPVAACTLWGAAGAASVDGTLLAKNRDWKPDHVQSLRLRHPEHGYAYLGLYADNGREPGIKAGVNEKGLAVVGAEASSLPRELRTDSARHGVLTRLLRDYGSLDEVAAAADKLFPQTRPVFLLLADASGLMQVEVGQHGRYQLSRQRNGTLAHTNHYSNLSLLDGAQKIGPSSKARLARIQFLLDQRPSHALAEFERLSQDHHDGPDNSLWRDGREHTLAGWQMALPVGEPPRLHLVLANPGEHTLERDYALDAAFWSQPARTLLP
ncbi:carcinine hydrolase/isopenicillin-N N-acyltransferase family protein [Chromobacterium vaccinii]|uniref:carcinine hydrolase/isopenicillin-N N-acyltransferase family protein n=1 Tax=Chromobacterium vaccinii TaxID=1108595 RepID=UPI0031CF9AF2